MSYLVENDSALHEADLRKALEICFNDEPDMCFVCENGSKVYAKRIFISMYSNLLSDILSSFVSSDTPGISIPSHSSEGVKKLLKLLTEGFAVSEAKESLVEAIEIGRILGIRMNGIKLKQSVEDPDNEEESNCQVVEMEDGEKEVDTTDVTEGNVTDLIIPEEIKTEFMEDSEYKDYHMSESRYNWTADNKINERKYSCNFCDYQTKKRQHLKKHQESIHEGIKHPCDQCDYKATAQSSLKRHKQTKHEGIKYSYNLYPCDQCPYKATTKSSLKRHKKTKHEGIKYYCDQCAFQSAWPSDLSKHKRNMHYTSQYFCDKCEYEATSAEQINIHKQSEHSAVEILPQEVEFLPEESEHLSQVEHLSQENEHLPHEVPLPHEIALMSEVVEPLPQD